MKQLQLLIFFLSVSLASLAQQSGGMWIPNELNEKEMKQMGMKISAKDIFSATVPSIKDAVVHFGGGCTGQIISGRGLLLTNHHCGYGSIQRHSSVENDLLKNGFWAKNMKEELPNPGLTATFIVDVKDVTSAVVAGAQALSGEARRNMIKKNVDAYLANYKPETYQTAFIRPFYKGNKYYLIVQETFKDVRLVGTPPEAIGKFGADTDNWVWPRHTGDFALFRVYADKNNKPAEYAESNVPYKPKYFLPVSSKGIKENDFVFVYGFPGATDEYLPAIALEKLQKETNPARIEVRDAALKIMGEKMRTDEATRIKYASKFASIANYWKKWIGENQGLQKSNAVEKRKTYEQALSARNPRIAAVLSSFENLYNQQAPYGLTKAYYDELIRNAEGLKLAMHYNNFMDLYATGSWKPETKSRYLSTLQGIYVDYDPMLDAQITSELLALTAAKIPQQFLPAEANGFKDAAQNLPVITEMYKTSLVSGLARFNGETVNSNLEKVFADEEQLIATLKKDKLIMLARHLRDHFNDHVAGKYNDLQDEIDDLQKEYMALQMQTDKNKVFFPDANSTLRVTYGKVKGSRPRDAVEYLPQTYLKGVMEKYVAGDYEFDVPAKLITLYNKKDFGKYKDRTGDVPLAFTSTSHTTGGNSGSPAIDANGNLVGLNFDRQWEGTMSDLNYDPEICRNIMVDVRYILFIVDKFADAKWLLKEMKIVDR